MLIASTLPPHHTEKTFFNSGRSAFAFLVGEVIKPKKIYLPSYNDWSFISVLETRFPFIEIEYYPVNRELTCCYPQYVYKNETLVFIHYFGHQNSSRLPKAEGTILEDISHSYMSEINHTGDYIFGSYRKILKVGDGGFINSYFNPIYEESKKLDTWLRYEAKDWRDMREAENMIDRNFEIADMSSQALSIVLNADHDLIRNKRQENDKFLNENISVGRPLLVYKKNECPLVHNRILETQKERDSLRRYLAGKKIFTAIHWPTHNSVKYNGNNIDDTLWIENHIISIPVSHDYNLNDMDYICECIKKW